MIIVTKTIGRDLMRYKVKIINIKIRNYGKAILTYNIKYDVKSKKFEINIHYCLTSPCGQINS